MIDEWADRDGPGRVLVGRQRLPHTELRRSRTGAGPRPALTIKPPCG